MNMFGILAFVICAFTALSIYLNGLRRVEKERKESFIEINKKLIKTNDGLFGELHYWQENVIKIPTLPDYDNWDDFGAHAITDKAKKMLKSVNIFPADDGGIDVTWHRNGQDLELHIGPDGKFNDIDFEE